MEEGFCRNWYENGQLRSEGNYNYENINGSWIYYDNVEKYYN